MIAAIQLLKERPVTNERQLAAEFSGLVEFEITIKRHDEGMCHLFAEAQESSLSPVMCAQG